MVTQVIQDQQDNRFASKSFCLGECSHLSTPSLQGDAGLEGDPGLLGPLGPKGTGGPQGAHGSAGRTGEQVLHVHGRRDNSSAGRPTFSTYKSQIIDTGIFLKFLSFFRV